MKRFPFILSVFVLIGLVSTSVFAQKMKAEDLVEKHLNAIGTAEARQAVKSMMAAGKSKVVVKGSGGAESEGIGVVSSSGMKRLVGLKFDIPQYPGERIAFDGEDVRVNFQTPGQRSKFGDFVLSHKKSFRAGIFGGALTTGWELLNYDPKRGKLKCGKPSKMDGKQVYKCSYKPKKGDRLKMSMFFDAQTFQHVMTEYRARVSARQGASIDQSSSLSETKYKLVERFGDFKKAGDLMLPHSYEFTYERTGTNRGLEWEWRLSLNQFAFNKEVPDSDFLVDKY